MAKNPRLSYLVANKFILAIVAGLATIITTFVVHTVIGISVNTSAVVIYDDFPQEF